MARTQGHGNPRWTRDETILALDLYFECGGAIPPPSDPRLQRFSELLRSLPYHAEAARKPTFRNPDGVGFKLQNLRSVATGKGLGNTSKTDREIWNSYGGDPARIKELADLIEHSITLPELVSDGASTEDEPEEFFEGRVLTMLHQRRERHPGVRKALLAARAKQGALSCDLCNLRAAIGAPLEDAIFEAHHLLPLAMAVARKTRLEDVALVCSNCHRLVHRLITHHKRWLTLPECQEILAAAIASQNVADGR